MASLDPVVFTVVAGFASAVLADRKGRGGTSWGVMTFLLPFLVAVIIFLRPLPGAERKKGNRESVNGSGIALGVIFMMAGLALLFEKNPGEMLYSLYGLGFGAFVI